MKKSTTTQAKRIIRDELIKRGLPFTKLTARTVSFSDLARDRCVFVKIHGWKPNPAATELAEIAARHGFRVEFFGTGFISGPSTLGAGHARGVKIWIQADILDKQNAATGMYYWAVWMPRKKHPGATQRKPMMFESSYSMYGEGELPSASAAREAAAEEMRAKFITGRVEGVSPGERSPHRLWLLLEVYAERDPAKNKYRYVTVALPPENHRTKPRNFEEPSLAFYASANEAVSEGLSWLRNNYVTGRYVES